MNHGDVTSVGMRLQVEQAIQSLAPCIRIATLDTEGRRQLLLTVDMLTSVWSDLQRGADLMAEQNIREALQLAEVDWPDLDGSESVNSMEARIRNADITVVVVRYSRTHWKEARDIARQYGKQFVMATRGYGVTHLAQQIVQQCARS